MAKHYRLEASEIRPLVSGHGYCLPSDHITVHGRRVGFMYCQEPDAEGDSGWVYLSGLESQEYLDEPSNSALYDVNTIANYDPTIIPYLTDPVGVAYARDPDEPEFRLEPMPDHLRDH
jgi:hypothetical protein